MIKRINNFLSEDIITQIQNIIRENINSPNWKTSMFWQEPIKKSSSVVSIFDLGNYISIKELILKHYEPHLDLKKFKDFYLLYYIWPPLSYIPFHFDEYSKIASTIYLNKNWDKDHGGLFMCKKDDDYLAITPKYNHCIINSSDEIHGTTLTTTDAPKRETLQIFFS
jgi:hypothetical protein